MKLHELPMPALVIGAEVVRENIAAMGEFSSTSRVKIRPHTKTHKSKKLAAMQMDLGCIGLTVAKVGEAEVMAEVCDDLLIAYPALDESRTHRIARLAREKAIHVAVDSAEAVVALGAAASAAGSRIGILVDLDVGMGRTGVQSSVASWQLAECVLRTPGARLDGILCYPGHIWKPANEQTEALAAVSAMLAEAIELWKSHGEQAKIVSGGSTPTAYQSHLVKEYTEIRPGTYIFNDMNTVRGGWCSLENCAARIVCTVVSTAVPGQVVIDAGSKTLTSVRCIPAPDSGHGYVVEYPQATITKLSEEHGQVDIRQCDRVPKLGERFTVVPNHICPCINLQDDAWWMDGDDCQPVPIDARGLLS